MASRTIRILKGSVTLKGVRHLAGEVFHVPEDVFQFLQRKTSASLRVEEVRAVDPKDEDLQDGRQEPGAQGAQSGEHENEDDTTTHTGEGENVAGEKDVEATAGASVPASVPSTPSAPSSLPLASVDQVVAAGLVAAGWDSVEKLKTATETDLVKVKGIGLSRARAILQEVAEL